MVGQSLAPPVPEPWLQDQIPETRERERRRVRGRDEQRDKREREIKGVCERERE